MRETVFVVFYKIVLKYPIFNLTTNRRLQNEHRRIQCIRQYSCTDISTRYWRQEGAVINFSWYYRLLKKEAQPMQNAYLLANYKTFFNILGIMFR
jgi:hypothetical protein